MKALKRERKEKWKMDNKIPNLKSCSIFRVTCSVFILINMCNVWCVTRDLACTMYLVNMYLYS